MEVASDEEEDENLIVNPKWTKVQYASTSRSQSK